MDLKRPPLIPPSVGKIVFRAGKRSFSWEGGSRWGFGPGVFEARTETAQMEGGPPQLRSIQPEVISLAGGGVSKDTEGRDLKTNEYVGWYEI